jgi:hypothetical protein
MALTNAQITEAIAQMVSHCKDLEHNDYHSVSARGVLYTLGYEADVDQILQRIYDGGFTYCLDSNFRTKDNEYVTSDVCYWGPDQLRSRLNSLYWYSD